MDWTQCTFMEAIVERIRVSGDLVLCRIEKSGTTFLEKNCETEFGICWTCDEKLKWS